jgi:hypothetical protein
MIQDQLLSGAKSGAAEAEAKVAAKDLDETFADRLISSQQLLVVPTLELLDSRSLILFTRSGTQLTLARRKQNWGEDRLMYFDGQGALRSMLASWTSLGSQDLFAQASAGRSWFRTDDLVRLSVLVCEIPARRKASECQANYAVCVSY